MPPRIERKRAQVAALSKPQNVEYAIEPSKRVCTFWSAVRVGAGTGRSRTVSLSVACAGLGT